MTNTRMAATLYPMNCVIASLQQHNTLLRMLAKKGLAMPVDQRP